MKNNQRAPEKTLAQAPNPPVLAPVLMMVFWMLLGASAGIRLMDGIWRFIDLQVGELSIVVPVGGVVGAVVGGLLGLVSNPRLQVLLMAMFAGAAAGAVAGMLPWGNIGEIGGQVAGGLVGGVAWWTWMFLDRRRGPNLSKPEKLPLSAGALDEDSASIRLTEILPRT